jgi:hypothetical protein
MVSCTSDWLRRAQRYATLLAATTSLMGCSNPESWKWDEKVLLSDGTEISLERVALRNNVWPNFGPNSPGYRDITGQRLFYKTGGPVNISWHKDSHETQMSPFAFDRIGSQIYLVGTPINRQMLPYCHLYPRQYAVVILAHATGGWAEVPQTDVLLDSLHANLMWNVRWGESTESQKPPNLTVDEKQRRARQDFRTPTARAFLTGARQTCADVLERAGYRAEAAKARSRPE